MTHLHYSGYYARLCANDLEELRLRQDRLARRLRTEGKLGALSHVVYLAHKLRSGSRALLAARRANASRVRKPDVGTPWVRRAGGRP